MHNSDLPTHMMTEKEVADYLHVSLSTVRRWRLLKQLPRFTKIGSAVRYKPSDVADFLSQCPTVGR
jgi:excisionase family DNA binding protein